MNLPKQCSLFLPIPRTWSNLHFLRTHPLICTSLSDISFHDCLSQLFSEHELALLPSLQLLPSDHPPDQSLAGTFALLLTNPSLTDYLSNYPIWPNQVEDSNMSLLRPSSPLVDYAAPSFKRGRGRPRKKTRVPLQPKVMARNMASAPRTETQMGSQERYQL